MTGRPSGDDRFRWRRDMPALAFAMAFPTLATWLYFVVFAGRPEMRPVTAAGKLLQFAFPVLWVRFAQGRAVRPPRPTGRGLAAGIAFGLLAAAAMLATYALVLKHGPAFTDAPAMVRAKLADLHVGTRGRFLVLAFAIAVVHALLEEYYWRWFVFGQLRDAMGAPAAVALSSLAFTSHHLIVLSAYTTPGHFWDTVVPLSAGVTAGGAAWAWLYRKTGSLYGPWASHALADAALMAIGYDLVWGMRL